MYSSTPSGWRNGPSIYTDHILQGLRRLKVPVREVPYTIPMYRRPGGLAQFAALFSKRAWLRAGHPLHIAMTPLIVPGSDVVTVHGSTLLRPDLGGMDHPCMRLFARIFRDDLLSFPKRLITVSQTTKEEIVRYTGFDRDRIDVAPPGVDLDLFKRRHPIRSYDKISILNVGLEIPRKELRDIILALGRLGPDRFRLIHAGPSPDPACHRANVALAASLGLELRHRGYVDHEALPALYSASDLFIFPSSDEAAPNPPLEAMACGLDVVASDLPQHRERLGDAATFVKVHDIDGLAHAIERTLGHPRPKALLRAQAGRFSWGATVDAHLRAYESAGIPVSA